MKQTNLKKNKNRQDKSSSSRFQELLFVLRKHKLLAGLSPEKLRRILEDLGPTYVKLGQIMSMRTDILPQSYCEELSKLQATVHPIPYPEIATLLEAEFGTSLNHLFSEIDREPLGSASIAQVYRAVLKDSGEKVVLKVQRPNIKETMYLDIKLMRRAIRLLKLTGSTPDVIDFNAILDEFWAITQQEIDFLLEADHNEEFAQSNQDIVYVTCPKVYRNLTTSRVLVMEYIDGIPISETDRLLEAGYDMNEIGIKLAENYTKQIMDDAFFHADPHPGNIRILDGKIVFLDLGMMGRLSKQNQKLVRTAIEAVVKNDIMELKNTLLMLGEVKGKINHTQLYTDIDDMLIKYADAQLDTLNLGKTVQELLDLATVHQIKMPANITMLARGLMTIEGVLSKFCPEVSLIQILKTTLSSEILNNFNLKKQLLSTGKNIYHSLNSGTEIPAQLSVLLKMMTKGQTKMNLELVGSEEPLDKVDTMVNKIIMCIISAALLMGSSIICTTNMKPTILGIPFLGFLGFMAALILCGKIVFDTAFRRKK